VAPHEKRILITLDRSSMASMKGARSFPLVAIALLLMASLAALPASAGDENSPEVTDSTGDATTSRDDMDIVSAWVQAEDNTTLTFRIKLSQLSVFSPRSDWQSLPQIFYDYYFTIKGEDYALRAQIPVHGPLAVFAVFNLYTVEYGASGDNMTFTDANGTVGGVYSAANAYIQMDITKDNVNKPDRGDLITKMWAAVWFQPRGQDAQRVDSAMSYSSPGRNYLVKGQFLHYYDVKLEAHNLTVTGAPRTQPARFNLTIRNHSDIEVWVNLTNTTIAEPEYEIRYSRNDTGGIHVGANESLPITLTVVIPDNATNGTDIGFRVWGVYEASDGSELETNELNLQVQVRFIPPKPPQKSRGLFDVIKEYSTYLYVLIVVVVLLGALYVLFERRKRQEEEEDLLAFQAYVEAAKAQRGEATALPPDARRMMPP
jgi:hypothetical protein